MKISFKEKFIAWLSLLGGLSISGVAIYYSVAGLVSIFAASAIPIIVMGVTLEVGKIISTVWLKQNWNIAPKIIKIYLVFAILILMTITSMGIFGFLSKAHLDQIAPIAGINDRIAIIDEKIRDLRNSIDVSKNALAQMDATVDQTIARTTSEGGASRAASLRRSQSKERGSISAEIAQAQSSIAQLNKEKEPLMNQLRRVEVEVGPIKYIAALIYDQKITTDLLENAVRWVIILIVCIFDPLAIAMLLASQHSFNYFGLTSQKSNKKTSPSQSVVSIPKFQIQPQSQSSPVTSIFWKKDTVYPLINVNNNNNPSDTTSHTEEINDVKKKFQIMRN